MCSSDLGGLADGIASAVIYDGDDKTRVTLAGSGGTRLGNVSSGALNAGSMEAVNGAQLFVVGDAMARALGGGAAMGPAGFAGPDYVLRSGSYNDVGSALGALDGVLGGALDSIADLQGRIGKGEQPSTKPGLGVPNGGGDGIAIGDGSHAQDGRDTAIGDGTTIGADNGTAVGAGATITTPATEAVALGADSSVSAKAGTAIGRGATTTAEGAVALSQGSIAEIGRAHV